MGVCEADGTYLLDSYKGKKLAPDIRRKPRKHGAVATKPGLSKEYVCVCAGVERDGRAISLAVNRSTASKEDIDQVFGDRVSNKTVVLSDGAKGYGILEKDGKCTVLNAKASDDSFFNINTVNGYHSFIKDRNRNAHGVATKYLNRYNALFSKVYRTTKAVVDDIYMSCSVTGMTATVQSLSRKLEICCKFEELYNQLLFRLSPCKTGNRQVPRHHYVF